MLQLHRESGISGSNSVRDSCLYRNCKQIPNRSETKGNKSFLFSMDHVFFDVSQKRGGRMRPRRPQTQTHGSRRRASCHTATPTISHCYDSKLRNEVVERRRSRNTHFFDKLPALHNLQKHGGRAVKTYNHTIWKR